MSSFRNIRYVLLAFSLIIILVTPFVLKLKRNGLEIFPSIIMPSGANLIYKHETINFFSYEIYAKKKGELKKVDIKAFLDPIPEWYIYTIAKSNFGFDSISENLKLHKLQVKFKKYNRFNANELQTVKKYYKEKLEKLNFDDSVFIYRSYSNQILDSSINKKIIFEKNYSLK